MYVTGDEMDYTIYYTTVENTILDTANWKPENNHFGSESLGAQCKENSFMISFTHAPYSNYPVDNVS